MEVDERRRLELAEAARRTLGEDAGITLMELLPPVGWADVATKHDLEELQLEMDGLRLDIERVRTDLQTQMDFRFDAVDQRFEILEHKVMGALHKEMTAQTWRLVTAATAMFGLFAVIVRL